jgi:hypothetical protein
MKEILQEIKFVPGVVGAMIHQGGKNIAFSNIPEEFDHFLMEQVGRVIGRIYNIRGKLFESLDTLTVFFEEYSLVCVGVRKGTVLIILGDRTAKPDLVTITAVGLVPEIASQMDADQNSQDM